MKKITAVLKWQKLSKIDDEKIRDFVLKQYIKHYKKKSITVYTNTFY